MAAVDSEEFEWNYENICKLIECYEKFPCLCNTKSKEYRNSEKRDKALREIAETVWTTRK